MSSNPIDLERMFKEIKTIYEKYDIPRGILFVPDKLEITLQRIEENKFSLAYQESFRYLPDYALNFAIQEAIQLLQQSGLPITRITHLEKSVKVEMTADMDIITSVILSELLVQKPLEESDVSAILDSAKKGKEMFTNFSDLCWTWDENTAKRFNALLQKLNQIKAICKQFREALR